MDDNRDKLDISTLIEEAQRIVYENPQLGFASSAEYPIQDLKVNGQPYRLSIKLTHMDVVSEQQSRMTPYLGND
jgi:hypothetical protein